MYHPSIPSEINEATYEIKQYSIASKMAHKIASEPCF